MDLTGELIQDAHPVPTLLLDKGPQKRSPQQDLALTTWLLFYLLFKSFSFAHIFGEDMTF